MTPKPATVTVQDASPSPPPLPNEPLPTASSSTSEQPATDQPINSLGEGESDDEEEWDPAAERLPGDKGDKKDKGKSKATEDEGQPHSWQAVWSAEKNAWYFWNTSSGEVTWTNPLDPSGGSSSTAPPLPSGPAPRALPIQPVKTNGIPDIDPDLAYLLPSESRYLPGADLDPHAQIANFNARTGKFATNDNNYSVDHLDEYNRMKRFNSHYFDQDKWEADMKERNRKRELEGEGSRKISKKEMDRFKAKKQEKRMRSQAWLRD